MLNLLKVYKKVKSFKFICVMSVMFDVPDSYYDFCRFYVDSFSTMTLSSSYSIWLSNLSAWAWSQNQLNAWNVCKEDYKLYTTVQNWQCNIQFRNINLTSQVHFIGWENCGQQINLLPGLLDGWDIKLFLSFMRFSWLVGHKFRFTSASGGNPTRQTFLN